MRKTFPVEFAVIEIHEGRLDICTPAVNKGEIRRKQKIEKLRRKACDREGEEALESSHSVFEKFLIIFI